MDPFSAEGELLNIQNTFHQGQYQSVIDYDVSLLSTENVTSARVLQLRAQIANNQADEAIARTDRELAPDLAAVNAFALYAIGNTSRGLYQMEKLLQSVPENVTVQVLGGTVLHAEGRSEEALSILSKHQGNLEAIALIVQLHLQQNRTDLAVKEVQAARRWAQDSLLVNIAESWVGLRLGGEKYQQAFYVFEELAQAPSTSTSKSLISQAVAELHLGRLSEAEAALQEAVKTDSRDTEALANSIVLQAIQGKDTGEVESSLRAIAPEHPFLLDLEDKKSLFDQAATKYSPKVSG